MMTKRTPGQAAHDAFHGISAEHDWQIPEETRQDWERAALAGHIVLAGAQGAVGAETRTAGQSLDLRDLHAANIARQAEWCPDQVPDLSFRGNELGGECGEAQNVIKKLERERQGWRGSRATKDDLADELADVVICADLCAVTADIDLGAAVRRKFNATSEKQGLSVFLPLPALASPRADSAERTAGEDSTRAMLNLTDSMWRDAERQVSLLERHLRRSVAWRPVSEAPGDGTAAWIRYKDGTGITVAYLNPEFVETELPRLADAWAHVTPAPATPPGVPDSLRALSEVLASATAERKRTGDLYNAAARRAERTFEDLTEVYEAFEDAISKLRDAKDALADHCLALLASHPARQGAERRPFRLAVTEEWLRREGGADAIAECEAGAAGPVPAHILAMAQAMADGRTLAWEQMRYGPCVPQHHSRSYWVMLAQDADAVLTSHPAGQSAGSGAENRKRDGGQRIIDGLKDAVAFSHGDNSRGRLLRVENGKIVGATPAPDSTRTGQGEAEELREEVAYWRRDLAARLWAMTALYKAALDRGEGDRAADLANALRSALASYHDAENGEWYERCELCGEFVRDGEPRAAWEDVSGHARCLSEDGNGHVDPHGDEDLARWVGEAQAALDAPRPEVARPAAPEAQGAERRPIETAPKDRSEILLFGTLARSRAKPSWFIGAWFPTGERGEGWWVSSCVEVIATEWAPLPAPPASSGQGGR